jgi:hypothetical protein
VVVVGGCLAVIGEGSDVATQCSVGGGCWAVLGGGGGLRLDTSLKARQSGELLILTRASLLLVLNNVGQL